MKKKEYSEAFIELNKHPNEIKELSSSFENGTIKISAFLITPGIFLSLNEVQGSSIPFDEKDYLYKMTTINQCLSGRCEFRHPGEAISYISPQLTCIARKRKMNAFYYPMGHYIGLEISIIEELIDAKTAEFLNTFSIDIKELINKYLKDSETYIGRTSPELLSMFGDLYLLVRNHELGKIRLKVLEFFSYILGEELLVPSDSHFLTTGQAALARRANEILTSDLSRHIAMKDIASSLGVSETGLKNYFKEVYGICISEYMKNKRMKYAADKLTHTSLSVFDIANSVGYTNQGRFAKVFYDFYKMNPLEYRRKTRTNQ